VADIDRRTVVAAGGAALITSVLLRPAQFARAAQTGETVVPWLDQPADNPIPEIIQNQLKWEDLDSWITPNNRFFSIAHFNRPVLEEASWKLDVDGLVQSPKRLTLADLKARPKTETVFTLECSGNHGPPFFTGGIGNANWGGTPLAAILDEAGVTDEGIEVVFWGADVGDVTLKDGLRDVTMHQHFARAMSLADAMSPDNLLCYEMNGAALPPANGFPVRLIAPGWYGIANVKWLTRIEVRPTRFMNQFMARDYVTIREEVHDGEPVWAETSVGPALLKSAPARVTRSEAGFRINGAAWGGPIANVEIQVDDGPWQSAELDRDNQSEFAWVFWSLDWADATPGEHTITSRVSAADGTRQPTMEDPVIKNKHTIWESNGQITRRVLIPS
jgi:DMSO/TMAO reductase YedYZ molybdopterin-dependent catalytic subunit